MVISGLHYAQRGRKNRNLHKLYNVRASKLCTRSVMASFVYFARYFSLIVSKTNAMAFLHVFTYINT